MVASTVPSRMDAAGTASSTSTVTVGTSTIQGRFITQFESGTQNPLRFAQSGPILNRLTL